MSEISAFGYFVEYYMRNMQKYAETIFLIYRYIAYIVHEHLRKHLFTENPGNLVRQAKIVKVNVNELVPSSILTLPIVRLPSNVTSRFEESRRAFFEHALTL